MLPDGTVAEVNYDDRGFAAEGKRWATAQVRQALTTTTYAYDCRTAGDTWPPAPAGGGPRRAADEQARGGHARRRE